MFPKLTNKNAAAENAIEMAKFRERNIRDHHRHEEEEDDYSLRYPINMSEYNPMPYSEMTASVEEHNEISADTSCQYDNNEEDNEDKALSAAADSVMEDPSLGSEEEDLEKMEAFIAGAGSDNDSKVNIDNAIRYIMDKNTADFKDFHFSSNIQDILFNRMQQTNYGRIKALKADRGQDDVRSIIRAYRGHHSKADDIKYLTSSFHEMELLSQNVAKIGFGEKTNSNAEELPEHLLVNNRSPLASPVFEMDIDVELVQIQKDRSKMRRLNSGKRVVRFKKTEEVCEYWAEPDETNDD